MNNLVEIISLLAVFLFLNYLTFYFWKVIIKSDKIAIFLLPGIVIHELFHILGCFLTGTKITKIKLFSLKGGYVKYKKRNFIISLLISLFPVIGGLILLYVLLDFFDLSLYFSFNINFLNQIKNIFLENYKSLQFWLLIYFSTTVFICMTPSKKDFQNAFWGILLFTFFLFLFSHLNLFQTQLNFIFNVFKDIVKVGITVSVLPFSFGFIFFCLKYLFKMIKI